MISITDKSKCCGCSACEQICPKKAISMQVDEKGFLYPTVNTSLCINCGLCDKICPMNQENSKDINTIKSAYALQHNSEKVLKKSSSGGAFIAVSDYILENGGYIYGSVFDKDDFSVHHAIAVNPEERDEMCGSKYVQSETRDVFSDIKEKLKEGKPILFSGTPCQNAGLVNFLHGHPDNLYLIDLICHGVPSNKILKEHLNYWENKSHNKIINFRYRSKRYAYAYAYAYCCEIDLENGKNIHAIDTKRIIKLYTLNMRDSCYNCPFATKNRLGDITIGDFWNAHKFTKIKNAKGASIVFANTDKGADMIKKIMASCDIIEVKPEYFYSSNALSGGVAYDKENDEFWKDYKEKGYEYVLDKYAPKTLKSKGYNILWRMIYHLRLHKIALKLGLK